MNERELVERFRAAREDPGLVLVEGFHAIKHAARFGAELGIVVTGDPDLLSRMAGELAPDLADALGRAEGVPPDVFARLAPRPHPTGVLAIARRPAVAVEELVAAPRPGPIVLLEEPRRPENVGAAVRVAAAAGARGLLTLGGVDPWHAAAVRSAAGLQFALPVARIPSASGLRPAGRLIACDPAGEPLRPEGLPGRALVMFGGERHGLSESLLERADLRLAIPMRPGVSSLNLAVAVAVVLYAWRWSGGAREGS